MYKGIFVSFILLLTGCQSSYVSLGDQQVTVFENTPLNFDLAYKDAPQPNPDGIFQLDAGRVLVKKVTLPTYELQPSVRVKVSLQSKGDPWDKSGSLFVIPKSSGINLLDFESGRFNLADLNESYPAVQAFANDSTHYAPNVELLRFMTPFGVGFFNDHERVRDRKPVYIPHWEEKVTWEQDITHLLPVLEDEVYIGVFIDTWTKEGYSLSVDLDFKETTHPLHTKKVTRVLPLVNTSKYSANQRLFDGFHDGNITLQFNMPEGFKNAQLHYTTTGHGGHSEGDEFVKKENIITLDEQEIKRFIPWRDDCASFRRFNPSSGTWAANQFDETQPSSERIASSDLSRSNWCPGSDVPPEVINLPNLMAGEHTLKIEIPEAQKFKDQENNYWMVSAYITYDVE